jgi:glycosyltransferase involved in cell wall biosynthesis
VKIALLHERVGGRAGGGGGVRQMLELGVNLQDLGHEVVVCAHDVDRANVYDGPAQHLDVRGVHEGEGIAGSNTAMLQLLAKGMRSVARLVPDDVDVINAHEWPALRAGVAASRRLNKPLVWTRNDESFFERAAVPDEAQYPAAGPRRAALAGLGLIDLLDARHAREIVVLDRRNARMVERSYRRPAQIIQSGPAPAFFQAPSRADARRALGIAEDRFVVLAFAIFFPHRRFEDVVEAAAELRSEIPNLEVRIVGSDHADTGYADRVEQLVAERGLGGVVDVRRTGVAEEELRNLYAAASAYVFPNVKQTWGLAPLEALACRTPVVVSRGAGVHDVLEGRGAVQIVDERRPDQIAAALRQVASGGAQDGLEETREYIRAELNNRRYAERNAAVFAALS